MAPCTSSPYEAPFAAARAAGILPVVASGGRGGRGETGVWGGRVLVCVCVQWAAARADGRGRLSGWPPPGRATLTAVPPRRPRVGPARMDSTLGNNYYSTGLSSPACAPSAVSVGAVHDSNHGAFDSCDAVGLADCGSVRVAGLP
jgi:hypothetical protein